jgi:hypothetical protein
MTDFVMAATTNYIYTCAHCGGTFRSQWSEEEALAKKPQSQYWGDVPVEDCVRVCDDCWQNLRPEANPEAYQQYLDEVGKP